MARSRYYKRNPTPQKSLLEKVADDLPKGYPKAALDLVSGVGKKKSAWWILGGAAVATFLYLNRNKS